MRTDADRLRLWIMNDEGLYNAMTDIAAQDVHTSDAVDAMCEVIADALNLDNLTPFQQEFMPPLDQWDIRDMLAELIAEQAAI